MLGLCLLCGTGVQGQRKPIIDMHLHSHELYVAPGAPEPLSAVPAAKSTADLQERTLGALEKYNIVLAVTSGPRTEAYRVASPERIITGLGSELLFGGGAEIDMLRTRFKTGSRNRVLAEFAPQYLGLPANAPELEPYFAMAEELDVIVGIHLGLGPPGAAYSGFPKYRMANSSPLLLEEVLIRHPKLRLYVMHAGWPFLDEMVGLLYAHPQVHVDIGVINWVLPRAEFHKYLRRLVESGFANRIMYGSDQMQWPDAIRLSIEAVESADFLTEKQKRDILYNNAARFLRLTEQEIAKHNGRKVPHSSERATLQDSSDRTTGSVPIRR